MKRFFARIQEKATDMSARPVIITAFGDSVTQGLFEHQILDGPSTYHALLQKSLETHFPLTTFCTINAGVSGDSANDAIDRLNRDVMLHQPDLVFVAFGLNDSTRGPEAKESFEVALNTLIQRLRRETPADIVLLTPGFMAHKRSSRIHPAHEDAAQVIIDAQVNGSLADYAESIRAIASQHRLCVVDIFREWERLAQSGLDTDIWLSNGLNHPNKQGHRLAAHLVFNKILENYNS